MPGKPRPSWLLSNVLPLLSSPKLKEKSHTYRPTLTTLCLSLTHTNAQSSVGALPPTTAQISVQGSCLDTANKVLSQVDKNWCWTTQKRKENQASGQRSSTRKGSGLFKVTWDYNWYWKVFHLGKTPGSGYHKQPMLSETLQRKHFIAAPHQWAAHSADYRFRLQAFTPFQLHSRLIHLNDWQHRLLLSVTPRPWSWENHQNAVNHLRDWVSAKVSSITGPHLCGSQLWSTSNCTRLLTSLSSLSGRLSLSAWYRVFGDDLITFADSW